jgi:hypothetical protein
VKWIQEKTCLRAEVTAERACGGKRGAEKECGGTAGLGRVKTKYHNRSDRGLGRMMSHAFFWQWRRGDDLAPAVGALAVTVTETSFQTGLIAATRRPQLRQAGATAAQRTAIALPPVTRGTDEKQSVAVRGAAKPLPQRNVWDNLSHKRASPLILLAEGAKGKGSRAERLRR